MPRRSAARWRLAYPRAFPELVTANGRKNRVPTALQLIPSGVMRDGVVCFVGIGLPSEAANLARATHAPNCLLVYESGTIDTRPDELPLSIGDGVLAETALSVVGDGILADSALTVVSVPEIFNYWLQAGRMDVGFLSGAQIDRYANLNTTVIGEYDEPDVRLPGSGGAPEICAGCHEVIVVMRHRKRAFVDQVDFVTTFESDWYVSLRRDVWEKAAPRIPPHAGPLEFTPCCHPVFSP